MKKKVSWFRITLGVIIIGMIEGLIFFFTVSIKCIE